jgi:predicted RNase H-like HicB family nuclease
VKLYRLPVKVFEPSEDHGNKYLAEVPLLPGCRAWGDSAAEALDNVHSVAAAFLESYREHGDQLPPEVESSAVDIGQQGQSEVVVAV